MIALVSCAEARDADADLPLLCRALPEASVEVWDDPGVPWHDFDVVVVRSTWDYHRRRDEFLTWARGVADVTKLWNPADLIEWNTDKRYLADLATAGVPVVDSTYLDDAAEVDGHLAAGGFDGHVVVKPTVGASASGVVACDRDPARAAAHAHDLIRDGHTAMTQPYLAGVEERGETGLVYLGGGYSHAFRRRVVLPTSVCAPDDVLGEEHSGRRRASHDERRVGDLVMAQLPPTAYARIDLLPSPGGPVVLEVEVTEPSLFLHLDDDAADRAAAAFRNL